MGNPLTKPVESAWHTTIYQPPPCQYTYNDCSFVRSRANNIRIAFQLVSCDEEVKRRWNANQPYTDSRKLYLFSHGNACDLSTCDIDWALKTLDGNVLKWDYPGYGQSSNKYVCEESICESIEAMYHLCQQMKVPADKLVIVGQSLGSVPSLFLASREYAVNVHGILLISPLASAYRTMFNEKWYVPSTLTKYMDGILFDNIKNAAGVRVPVAIIHGLNDDVVDVSHVELLMNNLPSEAKYPPLKLEAGHNDIFDVKNELVITSYFRRFLAHCVTYQQHMTPYD